MRGDPSFHIGNFLSSDGTLTGMEQDDWIKLSSVIFDDVIDNGPPVKFVTNLIFPGIDPRFFERMFAYDIVNVFGV